MNGAVLTAISAVLVALISAAGLVLRARFSPKASKEDVTIPQLWKRVERLEERDEDKQGTIDSLVNERDAQRKGVRILGEGFDALIGIVERINPQPMITPWEREAVHQAKNLRADDSFWPTLQKDPKP